MSRKSYQWMSYVLAVVVAAGVVVRMSVSQPENLKTYGVFHYSLHLIAFGVVALPGTLGFPRGARWLAVWAAVSLFGLGTEFYEHVVAVSPIEWVDVLTDSGGALLGIMLAKAWMEGQPSTNRR